MNVDAFTDRSPGRLVDVPNVVGGKGFVPEPLPPEWTLPPALFDPLLTAYGEVRELNGQGNILRNPTVLIRPLADRESITSSRLEGTTATPRELLLFELREGDVPATEDQRDDWQEVTNYQRALDFALEGALPLSLALIRAMHEILLSDVSNAGPKLPGQVRPGNVRIGRGDRFVPPPAPLHVDCLEQFDQFIRSADWPNHPLIDCLIAHYQFEAIHPFNDGNGRVGRLLLSLMIQERCQLSQPWLYLSEFFEEHRTEYFDRLLAVSTRGDWDGWIEFGLDAVRTQAERTTVRCRRLAEIEQSWRDRLAEAGTKFRVSRLLDHILGSIFIDSRTAMRLADVSAPTARADLRSLEDLGILARLPDGDRPLKADVYFPPEIWELIYADLG